MTMGTTLPDPVSASPATPKVEAEVEPRFTRFAVLPVAALYKLSVPLIAEAEPLSTFNVPAPPATDDVPPIKTFPAFVQVVLILSAPIEPIPPATMADWLLRVPRPLNVAAACPAYSAMAKLGVEAVALVRLSVPPDGIEKIAWVVVELPALVKPVCRTLRRSSEILLFGKVTV